MIVTSGDTLEIDPNWLQSFQRSHVRNGFGALESDNLDTLIRCRGKVYGPTGAAASHGLKPTTLYGTMRKHRIHRDQPASD